MEEILVHYSEENSLLPDLGRMGLGSTAVSALVQLAGIISSPFFFFASSAESLSLTIAFANLQLTVLQEEVAAGICMAPEMILGCTAFHLPPGYSKAVLASNNHLIKNP